MTHMHRARLSKLSLGLIVALAAAPAFAQNTSAGVGGQVFGTGGQPVAGAEVTIVHTESGSVSRATTDANGRYNARGLRVGGPYSITVTRAGEGTRTQDNVFLGLDQVSQINVTLAGDVTTLGTVTAVAVGGSELFSAERMGAGTAISRQDLDNYASIQRNLQDYARFDPRISQTDKERGEISAGGQNSRFNTITIDGVATNDTFGLEANNLPTAKQPISIDAIESVQINISNFDVTQKGYTGANINAVTKSGTNSFSGSAYYVYRDENLSGDRYNRSNDTYFDVPAFEETTKGVTFGGPIIKDRLFFFAAYEDLRSTRGGLEFGPLGSERTNVAITPSAIAGVQQIAQSRYNVDVGATEAAAAELRVKDALLKLDANIGENHRASLRWSKTEQSDPIYPTNFNNAIALSSHWYSQDKTIETTVGELFSDWSDNFSTEIKVSYRDYISQPLNNSDLPQVRLNFAGALPAGSPAVANTSSGLVFGTERSRHFNDLGTKTWNYSAIGNLFLGDHTLKFGADYDDNSVYNAFLQDTRGNYTFACINSSATLSYEFNGGAAVTCNTLTRAQNEAAVLENFRRGRPSSYQVQVGAPGFTLDDGVANWDYQNLGVFLQDTWAVNMNLTLTAGVRVDRKRMSQSPFLNEAAAAPFVPGTFNPATGALTRASGGFGLRNDQTLDGNQLVQPRFGFNYTFDSDRPTQLRGGVGLFEGAAANVWLSNPYSNTGIATRVIGCGITGFAACPTADGLFNPDTSAQPTNFTGAIPAANVDFLSPSLRQPSVWKANLAFEHELPWWGVVAGIEYIRTEVKDAIYYRHLNLGNPTRQGSDGRDLFWTAQGYNTACFNNNGSTITSGACTGFRNRALSNPNFANALVAEQTSRGHGDNLTLSLSGRFLEDFSWGLAYAFTQAKEVSPLTSSVANSNWNSVSVFNPNEEVAANSAYLVRDRFTGQLNWSRKFFGDNATSVGLFYEGRKGKPYSWIYNNDLNGDGITNDLMYIPTRFGSGEVAFRGINGQTPAQAEALFWEIVNANGLNRFAGGVAERNSSFAKWTNTFDMRISQQFPGFFDGNKITLALDILNVGNLINKRWGQIEEVAFQSQGGLARSFVNYLGTDAQGRYIYGVDGQVEDFVTRQARGESQWAAQFTLRYAF
ncbi:TonB-dependent receptor [Luteimonas deserti]|uniref:TonB-dependent receptor n=1 Tax=Luteimonas deserti TaxID=2752306 RepID=A0A7Z0QSM6_9GAMM|nr:TonB-dependent receptor [Luteimonas deserti]NYZ62733.1 TonB-dependent receptor [Luteimonas deserti]